MTPDARPERRTSDIPLGDTSRILAIMYTIGFMGMAAALLLIDVPKDNQQIITSLVSIMATVQVGIVGYYFGSSKNAEVSQKAGIVARDRAEGSLHEIAAKAADGSPGTAAVITTT